MSPAAIAAVAELVELAAQLLKDHSAGKLSEADIIAKVTAAKAAWTTSDAAADAAAEAALDAKFPAGE